MSLEALTLHCKWFHLTTTAPMRANSWGLTNSHRIRHLNSGAGFLATTSSGSLLFTSASQWATWQNSRAETVSTAGTRMNFRATPGGLDVRVADCRTALWARLQVRLTAFPGCCEELYAGDRGDVYHLDMKNNINISWKYWKVNVTNALDFKATGFRLVWIRAATGDYHDQLIWWLLSLDWSSSSMITHH